MRLWKKPVVIGTPCRWYWKVEICPRSLKINVVYLSTNSDIFLTVWGKKKKRKLKKRRNSLLERNVQWWKTFEDERQFLRVWWEKKSPWYNISIWCCYPCINKILLVIYYQKKLWKEKRTEFFSPKGENNQFLIRRCQKKHIVWNFQF